MTSDLGLRILLFLGNCVVIVVVLNLLVLLAYMTFDIWRAVTRDIGDWYYGKRG